MVDAVLPSTLVNLTAEDLGTMRAALPGGRCSEGNAFLYVLAAGDFVKVGATTNPIERIAQHRANNLHVKCGPINRAWFSVPHRQARLNEKVLIKYCCDSGGRRLAHKKEIFEGLDVEAVIRQAAILASLFSLHEFDAFIASAT